MKNKLFFFFSSLLVLMMAGCSKKADEIFDGTPDERLNAALAAYQQTLVGATNGWKLFVFPKGLEKSDNISVGGFSYYVKFTADNRVSMVSDFDTTKAAVMSETGYRIKATQRPSIFFDTYSYIHIPADPDAAISLSPTGSNGKGWGTDFEFGITDERVQGDTIHLLGNQNNSIALLVKATKAEADAYAASQLKASMKKLKNLNALGYFKKMIIGNNSFYLAINESDKTITFNWLDATNEVRSFQTGYLSTLEGILLTVPFINGPLTVKEISFVNFDAGANLMNISVNNTAGTIINAGTPLKLDKDAPARWWQYSADRDRYWSSFTGFTINGVTDALKMRTITDFYANIYWANYNPGAYDAFSIFTLTDNTLYIWGPAVFSPPTFTTDGRIIFDYAGSFPNPPGSTPTMMNNYVLQIADPNGYYLIQTGPLKYDMVSKSGNAWITWEW